MKKIVKYILLFFVLVLPFSCFALENDKITLYFFHGDGCPHCADEEKFLETIEAKYENLEIVRYEVWYNEDNATLLSEVEEAFSISRSGVPTNVIGSTIITGFSSSVETKLERAIVYYQENNYEDIVSKIIDGTYEESMIDNGFAEEEAKTDEEYKVDTTFGSFNLKKISLMSATTLLGLIDGFNPCAMWVLLFLLGVLVGMKDRKRMWLLGLAFLFTSALVYMVIMLSWISVAVKITSIVLIRNIIAVVAIGGAGINLKSFLTANDSGCDVVDEKKRKKIFKKIKKFTSEKSFIIALVGVIGLAVSVNLVELACSAGLPLVFSELLAMNNVSSSMRFLYTLVYIFFFLADDLIVFFVAMFTMKVTGITTKYNKYSHLIGGIVMLIVGILLLFKPEWLMFNF